MKGVPIRDRRHKWFPVKLDNNEEFAVMPPNRAGDHPDVYHVDYHIVRRPRTLPELLRWKRDGEIVNSTLRRVTHPATRAMVLLKFSRMIQEAAQKDSS